MTTILLRRGDASEWVSANPVLADGEKGLELDTRKEKVGDGVTAWNNLPYGPAVEGSGGGAFEGAVVAVNYPGQAGWPERPTDDPNVVVQWIGGPVTPPGALQGVDLWVRPMVQADALPGSSFTVYYNNGWPARPSQRTDITYYWVGGDLNHLPPSVNGVDIWIRDSSAD